MNSKRDLNSYLTDAGWFSGRQVDTERYERVLLSEGYDVFPLFHVFLKEYGGLSGWQYVANEKFLAMSFHFDPIKAASHVYRERVRLYEDFIGERMVPCGEKDDSHVTVLISESGNIYGGFDDNLFLYGESIVDGVDGIVFGRCKSKYVVAS